MVFLKVTLKVILWRTRRTRVSTHTHTIALNVLETHFSE